MTADLLLTEIAVLMTCHNRRALTLQSLRSLSTQDLPAGYKLKVYLTDDGSTDATTEAVRQEFPEVTVIAGDGNLYWVRGTLKSWQAAHPAPFYLWFNDDVDLRTDAVRVLLDVYHAAQNPAAIIVGATCDPHTGKTCTGGMIRKNWYDVRVVDPIDRPLPVDTCNGNILLVPRAAEDQLGMIDGRYSHCFADGDYGLRARRLGIPLLLAPGHLGKCELNPLANTSFDSNLKFRDRWARLFGPKGYRPPDQWWVFVREHAPRPKVFYWAMPYVLFLVESLFGGKVRLRRHVRRPQEVV